MLPPVLRFLVAGLLVVACAAPTPGAPPRTRAASKTLKPALRTWSDVTGEHKIRAALVELTEEEVHLRKADGTTISVPLERLSKTDRDWLARNGKSFVKSSSSAQDWPGWLGPNRDGKSPDTGLLKQWPEGGPPLAWKVSDIGKGFAAVSVAGGTVYVTGQSESAQYIHAFDLDGKRKWKIENGPAWTASYPGTRGTPTIDGANLYVLSTTGLLGCFDAATGQRRWQADVQQFGGRPGNWGYAESVLLWQNLAIFKPGGMKCIVALDKATGQPVWTSQGVNAGPEYSSCLAVDAGGTPLVVTGTREGIVGVNATNGAFAWANPFSARNTANCPTPAAADGYVFWANGYGKGGICLKLNGATASQAWTTQNMVCHHGGYVIHEGYIYGNNGNGYACLDLKTGEKKWEERAVGKGSLCWADGMLYLFGERGGQAALATCSPDKLELRGQVKVEGEGPSWAHPVVIGGRLYLRFDTNLYAFDVKAK